VFVACIAVAFGYVAGGSLTRTLGSLAVTLWGVALAALLTAPGLLLVPASGLFEAPSSALAGLAYLVLISSVIGYVAWNWALAHGGIGRTGVLMFAQPILTIVLAALLLDERIGFTVGIPAAVILAGVAIARRG
jgi:drug/metabolite transporter (DMT)-like permease